MALNTGILHPIMVLLLAADVVILVILFMSKTAHRRRKRRKAAMSEAIRRGIFKPGAEAGEGSGAGAMSYRQLKRRPTLLFELVKELGDQVDLPEGSRQRFLDLLSEIGFSRTLSRQLNSTSKLKRLRSAMSLAIIGDRKTADILHQRLLREKKWYIRLAIIHSLARLNASETLPDIFAVLKEAPRWIREKCFAILPMFGEDLEKHIRSVIEKPSQRDRQMLFELAEKFPSEVLHTFLLNTLHSRHATLTRYAAQVLEHVNPKLLTRRKAYQHIDEKVQACGLRSLQYYPTEESIRILMSYLLKQEEAVVTALSRILETRPVYIDLICDYFIESKKTAVRRALAKVLESRLEYLISRIYSEKRERVVTLISELLEMRRTSVLFGFLERNSNKDIEDTILGIIGTGISGKPDLEDLCSRYLPNHLLEKLGLEAPVLAARTEVPHLKKSDRRILLLLLGLIVFSGPTVFILSRLSMPTTLSFTEYLKEFTFSYNYVFAFYSIAINTIYLLLLFGALIYLYRQYRYWEINSMRFLFAPELLPSISILAPAYNEEKNIIQNVKSLLNLHYPNVEVIIINDGSRDGTIQTLIDTFELKRTDRTFHGNISTEPLRGIYENPSYPNLVVLDKMNGGKADSLNAGINVASRDFICTIDSDSLLEHDALLKISYQALLTDQEPVAMGGNILPANGCEIRNGRLIKVRLSKNHVARFQTIEYLRAYLAGRLGWSLINSMAIISGAFGLFIRRRVIEVGGYLTPKSRMQAGTVGEDMELVIRLHEHLRQKKVPYRIFDAFNANCWTEVPDNFKILRRQRDRWHRGLIETILNHRRMILNPRYGPIGVIALPYFVIFELIGPFFEMYGYVNLALSVALGLISPEISLLLFVVVIMYGILISVGSLVISENEILYFNTGETLKIVLYAVLENFGFRQYMSALRVSSYIGYLLKEKSWGDMQRKGLGS